MNAWTTLFLGLLLVTTATRLWLAWRQLRHVAAHRESVPPAFADRVSIDAHRKAADYTLAQTRLGVIDMTLGVLVLTGLTLGGGLAFMAEIAGMVLSFGSIGHDLVTIGVAVLLLGLLDLPLDLYRTFVLEARFGFNRTSLRLWLADLAKGLALSVVLGLPLLATVLWLMRAAGPAWWLWSWAVWVAFNLAMLFAYPLYIAPLFNRFVLLADAALRVRIEALLDRCGFRTSGIFVMDGSRRSAHGNAYFTGFGRAKRVVFFDTLIERLSPREIEAVLAHELGHDRLRHVWKQIAAAFAMSFVALAALGLLIDSPDFHAGLGVPTPSTGLSLMLFFLVAPVAGFALRPWLSARSRAREFEADAFAASQVDAAELGHALVKLYEDNATTLTPDPLHSAVYDSHPHASSRIARLGGRTAAPGVRTGPGMASA